MKLKIVTIGILVLVLCATVPMAATAVPYKPPQKIFTLKVYLFNNGVMSSNTVGKLTVDKTQNVWSLDCRNVPPGEHSVLLAQQADRPVPAWDLVYGTALSDGRMTAQGKWISEFDAALANGGYVFIYI